VAVSYARRVRDDSDICLKFPGSQNVFFSPRRAGDKPGLTLKEASIADFQDSRLRIPARFGYYVSAGCFKFPASPQINLSDESHSLCLRVFTRVQPVEVHTRGHGASGIVTSLPGTAVNAGIADFPSN
jgi:hypothetical protein